MMDTEAFREFKTGLNLLRDNYADVRCRTCAAPLIWTRTILITCPISACVLAAEKKWGEAESLCDSAVRMKRNQAQLYLNLADVYKTAGRRDEAVEALQAGLKFARRDIRLTIAMNKLLPRRSPVLRFLGRTHPINRQLGILRHRTLNMLGQS